MCAAVAGEIAGKVHRKPALTLGLPTGSTPIGVYRRLVEMHRQGALDFSRITCFDLDEYFPMPPQSPHSYHAFMRRHLFDHINCQAWFVPDGAARNIEQVREDCVAYERRLEVAGGLDLLLLGIGRNGHIGFNEPGSTPASVAHLVSLDAVTRADAGEFDGLEQAMSPSRSSCCERAPTSTQKTMPGRRR